MAENEIKQPPGHSSGKVQSPKFRRPSLPWPYRLPLPSYETPGYLSESTTSRGKCRVILFHCYSSFHHFLQSIFTGTRLYFELV